MGLSQKDNARIQAEIEARTQAKLKGIVADLWKRTHECVFRISDRLKAYDEREQRIAEAQVNGSGEDVDTRTGTFTNTLISNLRELIEIMPDLDLTDDAELAAMRQRMLNQLTLYEADDLRKSPALRKRVTDNAEAILGDINKRMDDLGDFLA
jgi:hypothetical protein